MRLSVSELKNVIRQVIKESSDYSERYAPGSQLISARKHFDNAQGFIMGGETNPGMALQNLFICCGQILAHLEAEEKKRRNRASKAEELG